MHNLLLVPFSSHLKRLFLASPLHFSTVCFVFPTVARAFPLFVFSAFVYYVVAAAAADAAAAVAAAAAADAAAQHVARLCAFSSLHPVLLRFASKSGARAVASVTYTLTHEQVFLIIVVDCYTLFDNDNFNVCYAPNIYKLQ